MGASLGDLVAPFEAAGHDGGLKGGSHADGAGRMAGWRDKRGAGARAGGGERRRRAAAWPPMPPPAVWLRRASGAVLAPLGSTASSSSLPLRLLGLAAQPFMLLACFVAFGLASIIGIGDVILPCRCSRCHGPLSANVVIAAALRWWKPSTFNHRRRSAPHQAHPQNYYLWAALGGVLMAVLVTLFDWRGFEGTRQLFPTRSPVAPAGWTAAALLTNVRLGLTAGGEIMPTFTGRCSARAARS